MKDNKHITQFMLELYHLNAVTGKERKIIEEVLNTDDEVRLKYEELKKTDYEIKNKYRLDTESLFAILNNNNERIIKNITKPKERKKIILFGIAAVFICFFIPLFIYFNNSKKKNNINITKKEQTVLNIRATDDFYQIQLDINIPEDMTFIYENMFADMDFRSITIPDRITRIGNNAFKNNLLISVTIGANVEIEDNAIPGNFANVYNSLGKVAGTYERPNIISEEWVKK